MGCTRTRPFGWWNLSPEWGKKPEMRDLHQYTVVIRPDDNGTFVANDPAIPGCHAFGRTSSSSEAQAELAQVFEMIVEDYGQEGRSLPPDVPSLIAVPAKAGDLERAARKLGFVKTRQKGSHARATDCAAGAVSALFG